MESNAMLSWWGAAVSDGSEFGELITMLLLDDDGIARGACPETAFNEQVMQIDQPTHCNAWRAEHHASADDAIQHPRWYDCHYASGHLDVNDSTAPALLDVANLDMASV
jgi:hypothetical protein